MRNSSLVTVLSLALLTTACSQQPPSVSNVSSALPDQSSVPSVTNLVLSHYEVRAEGWSSYANAKLGISFQYPETFLVSENGEEVIVQRKGDTSSDKVTITKVQSTLVKEVSKHFYQASEIQKYFSFPSHPVDATVTRYQSGDAHSWFMTYFLTRQSDTPSFPTYEEKSAAYDVIVADVEAYPSEAETRAAVEINQLGEFLSEPQQILATLRFTE